MESFAFRLRWLNSWSRTVDNFCLFKILNQHQDTGIFNNILLGLEKGKQYKYFMQRK